MELVKTFAQKFLDNPAANEYPTLRAACEQGHVGVIKLFFKTFGPKIDIFQLFYKACRDGDVQTVELLIESVADINRCPDDKFLNPLQQASYHGHIDIVKILIAAKANVNVKNEDGWTPFFCACRKNYFEVAKLLIDSGADPNMPNYKGHTAIYMLCKYEYDIDKTEQKFRLVKKLLEIPQIDVNKSTEEGKTPLYQACRSGYEKTVNLLLPRVQESDLEMKEVLISIVIREKLQEEINRRLAHRKTVQFILFSQCKTGLLSSLPWDIVRHEIGQILAIPTPQLVAVAEPPSKKMKTAEPRLSRRLSPTRHQNRRANSRTKK